MMSTILGAIPYSFIAVPLVLALIAGLARSSIKILREYERAVVFTLGRFQRVKGPGLGVWSRDEVTWIEFEDVGRFGPGLADRFERRFPTDGFAVFGAIIG